MATVAQDFAVSLAKESSPIPARQPRVLRLFVSQRSVRRGIFGIKGLPSSRVHRFISHFSLLRSGDDLGKRFEFYVFFLLKISTFLLYLQCQTQWHLFPNAFLGNISPLSIKCTQTQQWTLSLGWHLNRVLGKINRSLLSSEEGIIYSQVWHSFCFLSLEKGEEMDNWNQGMWDLYQVTFVIGHHFYLTLHWPHRF